MAQSTVSRPAVKTNAPATTKTPRSIRLHRQPTDDRPGILSITQGDETTTYTIARQDAPAGTGAGMAFQLEKLAVQADDATGVPVCESVACYNVSLGGVAGNSCDCPWGLYCRRNGQPCRHVAGLLVLLAKGKLS